MPGEPIPSAAARQHRQPAARLTFGGGIRWSTCALIDGKRALEYNVVRWGKTGPKAAGLCAWASGRLTVVEALDFVLDGLDRRRRRA